MQIRTMTIQDYEQVYALWLSTPGMGLNDKDDSPEGIARYLQRNPTTCFVAEENGVVIGALLSGHGGRRGVCQPHGGGPGLPAPGHRHRTGAAYAGRHARGRDLQGEPGGLCPQHPGQCLLGKAGLHHPGRPGVP